MAYFRVKNYLTPSTTFEEASQLAYEAAVAHRSVEASGTIKAGHKSGKPAEHYSGVKGVAWEAGKHWDAKMQVKRS